MMGQIQQREAFTGRESCRAGSGPACGVVLEHFSFTSADLLPGTHPDTLATERKHCCLCDTVTTDNPHTFTLHFNRLYRKHHFITVAASETNAFFLVIWQVGVNYAITSLVSNYTPTDALVSNYVGKWLFLVIDNIYFTRSTFGSLDWRGVRTEVIYREVLRISLAPASWGERVCRGVVIVIVDLESVISSVCLWGLNASI